MAVHCQNVSYSVQDRFSILVKMHLFPVLVGHVWHGIDLPAGGACPSPLRFPGSTIRSALPISAKYSGGYQHLCLSLRYVRISDLDNMALVVDEPTNACTAIPKCQEKQKGVLACTQHREGRKIARDLTQSQDNELSEEKGSERVREAPSAAQARTWQI